MKTADNFSSRRRLRTAAKRSASTSHRCYQIFNQLVMHILHENPPPDVCEVGNVLHHVAACLQLTGGSIEVEMPRFGGANKVSHLRVATESAHNTECV